MEDKTQVKNFLAEFAKAMNDFRDQIIDFGDKLSKLLNDIEIPDKEEDTWKMKCPYEEDEEVWIIDEFGEVDVFKWGGFAWKNDCLRQGNTFPTKEAAVLESKRRNLLTRFRAFRDECNGNWKVDWTNVRQNKYYVFYSQMNNHVWVSHQVLGNHFHIFGYFKNKEDAERAIELFGDEIKELFVDCEG